MLLLSEAHANRTYDKPIAEATPEPSPVGSRRLEDLRPLAFMLNQVSLLMPTGKPRGRALTHNSKAANQCILAAASASAAPR
jgi:hypothetical protein